MVRLILHRLLVIVFMTVAAAAHGQTEPGATLSGTPPENEPNVDVEEPKPELERPSVWGEPTKVRVAIYVVDVDEVDSAKQRFSASLYLEARWRIPALQHEGPGPMHRSWAKVWTPRLTIANQQQAWRSFPERVEIQPDGEVIYRQKMWGYFSQPLNLREFPQDRQKLTIHMVAAGLRESEVQMVSLPREDGDMSGIAEVFSLPDFDVLSWKVEPHPFTAFEGLAGTAGFQMEIEVRRRIGYFVIKVIIPLCLIVIMSWVPRWVDPREFGASLGISATSVLTLIAYLFAITVFLPPVSYITRMDRFILLATIMVFASLLHTVLNTTLVRKEKTGLVERIDIWSRAVYPVVLILVLVVSFGL
jgi:hypothetical protein